MNVYNAELDGTFSSQEVLPPFVVHFAGQDPPQEMLIITWDSQQGQWYPHLTELLPHHAHVINIHRVPKKMYPRCYLKMCINFFWTPPVC